MVQREEWSRVPGRAGSMTLCAGMPVPDVPTLSYKVSDRMTRQAGRSASE
jgi:hypothetical protein